MARKRGEIEETQVRALKKKIKHLERENSRLRKVVNRSSEESEFEAEPTMNASPPTVSMPHYQFKCRGCNGNEYDRLSLGIRGVENVFLICKSCGRSHKAKS